MTLDFTHVLSIETLIPKRYGIDGGPRIVAEQHSAEMLLLRPSPPLLLLLLQLLLLLSLLLVKSSTGTYWYRFWYYCWGATAYNNGKKGRLAQLPL